MDSPDAARESDRADERQRGRTDASPLAAGSQDAPVERGVVCGQERRTREERLDGRPCVSKRRGARDVGRCDAMNPREPEVGRGRADQCPLVRHDTESFDANDAESAGAAAIRIRRLEVQRHERATEIAADRASSAAWRVPHDRVSARSGPDTGQHARGYSLESSSFPPFTRDGTAAPSRRAYGGGQARRKGPPAHALAAEAGGSILVGLCIGCGSRFCVQGACRVRGAATWTTRRWWTTRR